MSKRTTNHLCCWVKTDGTTCGKPTGYSMVKDDDGNMVRKYRSFCDEHQPMADAHPWDEYDETELEQLTNDES